MRPNRYAPLCGELLAEEVLQCLTILSELPDTLVELVGRHLVFAERPAELGLVVDERHLLESLALGRCDALSPRSALLATTTCQKDGGLTRVRIELLGDGRGVVLELLEQRGGDREEVDASEGLDLASL